MFDQLKNHLTPYGQPHLLDGWDSLSESGKENFANQLQALDLEQLVRITKGEDDAPDWGELAKQATAPPAVRLNEQDPQWSRQDALQAGEAALRDGKIGMILVAGGQGTRLGFDKPKGLFEIGPISGRTLFEMHIDRLKGMRRKYNVAIPLFVMTSPATDAETRQYFEQQEWFGLPKEDLVIFCQGTMPAVDKKSGKILLSSPGQIALSPDGHGGVVAAMAKHGCLKSAKERGITALYYAQVDNPLVEICDPYLLGYHILSGSQMTTQVVRKRFPLEKVGNVVSLNGRTQIIEYSDLPEEVAQQQSPNGELRLWAGNIAVHVIQVDFLQSVQDSVDALPFHRAHKAVPYVDAAGKTVQPDSPNAIKFERFVFDLLPLADIAIVVEGDAAEVFAPVKNADGAATDTPAACRNALVALHRKWLESAGATIEANVKVEIHPNWAVDITEVQEKLAPGTSITADTYLT